MTVGWVPQSQLNGVSTPVITPDFAAQLENLRSQYAMMGQPSPYPDAQVGSDAMEYLTNLSFGNSADAANFASSLGISPEALRSNVTRVNEAAQANRGSNVFGSIGNLTRVGKGEATGPLDFFRDTALLGAIGYGTSFLGGGAGAGAGSGGAATTFPLAASGTGAAITATPIAAPIAAGASAPAYITGLGGATGGNIGATTAQANAALGGTGGKMGFLQRLMGGQFGRGPGTPPINPNATTPRFPGPAWVQKLAGGINGLSGALGGGSQPSPYLSPEENAAAAQRQKMAMIGSLFQSAAPRPRGSGSALADMGASMFAGQQARDQFTADALRAKMVQAQIAQAQQGGQERADPNVIRALEMAGIDPKSQEGREIVIKSLTGGNDQIAALQAQIALEQRRDQLERDRRADAEKAEERTRARIQTSNAIKRSVSQTADIAGLVEGLEDSFLGAGIPASNWRRTAAGAWAGLAGAAGADTSKLEADIGKFDKLKKGLSDQLINLMSTGELGEATNAKLEQYQNALANTETSPPAIMSIQAGIAEALLEAADAQGVEVPDRDKIEANIRKWRAYESSSRSAAPIESLLDKYAPVP